MVGDTDSLGAHDKAFTKLRTNKWVFTKIENIYEPKKRYQNGSNSNRLGPTAVLKILKIVKAKSV